MTIDARAVGAFQVGEDHVVAVLLDLRMVTADSLIVQPQQIAFLTANREWHGQVAEQSAFVNAVHDLKGHLGDGTVCHPKGLPVGSFPCPNWSRTGSHPTELGNPTSQVPSI